MATRDFRPKLGLLSPRPLTRSLECIFSLFLNSCLSTSHTKLPPSFCVCFKSSCFWKAGWKRHAIPPVISTHHVYSWPKVLHGPCCDRWCLVQESRGGNVLVNVDSMGDGARVVQVTCHQSWRVACHNPKGLLHIRYCWWHPWSTAP